MSRLHLLSGLRSEPICFLLRIQIETLSSESYQPFSEDAFEIQFITLISKVASCLHALSGSLYMGVKQRVASGTQWSPLLF